MQAIFLCKGFSNKLLNNDAVIIPSESNIRLGSLYHTSSNRIEHFRAESPPRSEFSSASRTESKGECTVRYDSPIVYDRLAYRTEHFRARAEPNRGGNVRYGTDSPLCLTYSESPFLIADC